MVVFKICLVLCLFQLSRQDQDVNKKKYEMRTAARFIPEKLVLGMKMYEEDARIRLQEMNEMRFMYEESPHYEEGYLMSEILDRYKRMVYHAKRPMEHQSDNVFNTLRKTEVIQALYMEIYHLTHMMHEIPRKYRYLPEFADLEKEIDVAQVEMELKDMRERERLQKREKKKAQKVMKKMREMALQQGKRVEYPPKIRNKWWPIDYGWEIDYYW